MKRIAFFLSLLMLVGIMASAQNNKRTSAYMYNQNGLLDQAKEAIDEAVVHEKTMVDAKTWLYRGMIYYNISSSQIPAYKELDPNAAEIAYESLIKAKELDVKGRYKDDIRKNLDNLAPVFFNKGGINYNAGEYNEAIDDYAIAYDIAQQNDRLDTLSAYNLGIASVFAEKPEMAIKYLSKCVEVNFSEPRIYVFYNRALKQMGDTVAALEIIKEGRIKYPGEYGLLLEQGQTYLEMGQNDQLQATMLEAVEKDPGNANLYAILGQTYDNSGDKENAIKYYNKAIEVGSDSPAVMSNAYYNIGAIYNNRAADLNQQAAELGMSAEEQKKYEELHDEVTVNLEKALPYFEKALELNPDDQNSIVALKGIYSQLKMNDKLDSLLQK